MTSRILALSLSLSLSLGLLGPNMMEVSAFRPSQYGSGSGAGPYNSNVHQDPSTMNDYNPNVGANYGTDAQQYEYEYNIPNSAEHESVEERLRNWREQQQYKYEHQSPIDAANPRDEDGKMKLLASVSRGSIAMYFFILMWRAVHHYEMADSSFKKHGLVRISMVLPPVILFLGNMAGCVGSVMSSGKLGKKRMKAILNLNKLMEISLMAYNVMRLVLVPSKLIPREIYVGRTLTNFLFLVQCQLFTKVTWNTTVMKGGTTADAVYGNMDSGNTSYGYDDRSTYGDENEQYVSPDGSYPQSYNNEGYPPERQ